MKQGSFKALIFFFFLTCGFAKAQLSGVYAVPGSYSTVGAAIQALNVYGITGAVTVNIAAGHTETVSTGGYALLDVAGLSATNTIVFQKSGSGANPLLVAYTGGVGTPTSGTQDGVWRFIGCDYVTVDGIDIFDPNTSNPATMEYGYGFFKSNNNDGCRHNTIKNCTITLKKINTLATLSIVNAPGSRGIELIAAAPTTHTTWLTPITSAGSHSYNRFYANVIQDCNYGIYLSGVKDVHNEIGGMLAANGNTIVNYGGGGTLTAAGIYSRGQNDILIANNVVNNNNGSGALHSGELYGIYNDFSSVSAVIVNNTVTCRTGTFCPQAYAIRNNGGSSASTNTVTISNNLITGCTNTLAGGFDFLGIHNSGSSNNVSINGNSFSSNTLALSSGSLMLIGNNGVAQSLSISGNNLSFSLSGTASTFVAVSQAGGTGSGTVAINNNSFSNFVHTGSLSVEFISTTGTATAMQLNNNTWNGIVWASSGIVNLIHTHTNFSSSLAVSGNSIVNGFTRTAASNSMSCYLHTFSNTPTSQIVVSNNNFSGITSTVAGTGGFNGIYLAASAFASSNKQVYNNVLSNIIYNGTGFFNGLSVSGFGAATPGIPSSVHNNTVTYVSSGAGNTFGMYFGGDGSHLYSPEIYANTVAGFTSSIGAPVYGMYSVVNGTKIMVAKNKFSDFNSSNNAAVGIYAFGPTNYDVDNNVVSHMNGYYTYGIIVQSSGYHRVRNNSVYLTGNVSEGKCLEAISNSKLEALNNILVNHCTSTLSSGYVTALQVDDELNYMGASNNNLLFTSSTASNSSLAKINVSTYTTMPALKAALGNRDQNSVTENVAFASLTWTASNYMAISTATTSLAESAAIPVAGITTDYYGSLRNPVSPDIGAVEGTYSAGTSDQVPPASSSYNFTGPACNTGMRTFTATLSDMSGVAVGSLSPQLYYKINSGSYSAVSGTLTSGTATLGDWAFDLTYSATSSDVISYYLAVQDVTGNLKTIPSSTNPGSSVLSITSAPVPFTYTVKPVLAGSYTVGSSGTFTTLADAANAYNNSCLNGPVTFVLGDIYVYGATFMNNPDASATNSLLIVPAAATSVTLNTSDTAALRFLSAKYITIDGLNNAGRYLRIVNSSTISGRSDIYLRSSSVSQTPKTLEGCHHITIKRVDFGMTYTNTVSHAIYALGYNNDFVTITQNTVTGVSFAVRALSQYKEDYLGTCNDWLISKNQIGVGLSQFTGYNGSGAVLANIRKVRIEENNIQNVRSEDVEAYGISIKGDLDSSFISHNNIIDIKSDYYENAIGIDIDNSATTGGPVVDNNIVMNPGYRQGTTPLGPYAMCIQSGGKFIKYIHNTLALTQGSIGGVLGTSCIYFLDGSANLVVKNNIFHNTVIRNLIEQYVLRNVKPGMFDELDYNNYYQSTATYNYYAISGGTNIYTFNSLRSFLNADVNSTNLEPGFVSTTDGHLDPNSTLNSLFNNTGTPLTGFATDIDYQARSLSAPDVGADEYTPVATCTAAASGQTIYASGTTSVCTSSTLNLYGSSITSGVGTQYQWQYSTSSSGTYSNVTSGSGFNSPFYTLSGIPAGTYYFRLETTCPSLSLSGVSLSRSITIVAPPTLSLTNPGYFCSPGYATISASGAGEYRWLPVGYTSSVLSIFSPTGSLTYDLVYSNDPCPADTMFNIVMYYRQSPTVTVSGNTLVCKGSPVTLTAGGANSYTWSTGATGLSITPSPTAFTTYTVTGENLSGCTNTANISILTQSSPNLTVSASSATICSGQTSTLLASGGTTYTWSTGAQAATSTVSPLVSSVYTVTAGGSNTCTSTGTVSVDVVPAFTVSITGNTAICSGQTTTLTANGATNYSWTSGPTGSSISVSPVNSTTYVVSGESGGCSVQSSLAVNVTNIPTVSVSGGSNVCLGNSHTLTANGANSYSWNNGATSSVLVITPLLPTGYTVTGTTNGCSGVTSVMVNTVTAPSITIAASVASVCPGSAVTLTATGADTYTWSGTTVGSTATVSPVASTVYSVIGSNSGGCTNSQTVSISTFSLPAISINPASATVCVNSPVSFTASGASSFTWNGTVQGLSATLTPSANIVYQVSGTSSDGCVNSAFLPVSTNSLPVLNSTPAAATVCAGSSVSFTAGGASTYTWNGVITSTTINLLPVGNTAYTLTGTNAEGCTATLVVPVTSASLPAISINSSTTIVCPNSQVSFTATGAVNYTWSGGAQNASVSFTPGVASVYTVTGKDTQGCSSSATVGISTHSTPVITVVPASPTVCAMTPVSFTASGASTFTWNGSPNGNIMTYTPSTTAFYQLSGSSAQGCTNTILFPINVNANPVLTINPPSASVCAGGSVSFTASGAPSFTWNGLIQGASVSFVPFASTVYSVAGIDLQGCTGSQTVAVTHYSLPVITVSPSNATICALSSATLLASGANTYSWSNNSSGNQIVVSPGLTTVYTATGASQEGCLSVPVSSTIHTLALPVLSITASGSTVCAGQSVSLSASGGTYYAWNDGVQIITNTTNIVVNPNATTSYSLSGNGSNGCAASVPAVATLTVLSGPAITLTGFSPLCLGQSATLTASAAGVSSYSWSNGQTGSLVIVSPAVTTDYSLQALGLNSCISSVSQTLVVNPLPAVNISGPTTVCSGSSLTLHANGAQSYSWSTNASGSTISVAPVVNTTYFVTGLDNNNCSNSASHTVTILSLPQVGAQASSTVVCSSETVVLNGSGASSYLWSGGLTDNLPFFPSGSNSYTVTGTDNNGCTGIAVINLSVNPSPTLIIQADKRVFCAGDSVILSSNSQINYLWHTGDTTQSIMVSPAADTQYTLETTASNGCKDTAVYSLIVNDCTGLDKQEGHASVLVYPNPASGVFYVETENLPGDIFIEVYSNLGQIVFRSKVQDGVTRISLENYAKGLYTLRVNRSGSVIKCVKLVYN